MDCAGASTEVDFTRPLHSQPPDFSRGSLVLFGDFVIQHAEYDAAFADEVTVFGFDPTLYEGLRDADRQILDGEVGRAVYLSWKRPPVWVRPSLIVPKRNNGVLCGAAVDGNARASKPLQEA